LVAWEAGNLWQYEPFVHYITGLIISGKYNAQTILSGIPAMFMACVKAIATNHRMFVNSFATNVVKTTQIHS